MKKRADKRLLIVSLILIVAIVLIFGFAFVFDWNEITGFVIQGEIPEVREITNPIDVVGVFPDGITALNSEIRKRFLSSDNKNLQKVDLINSDPALFSDDITESPLIGEPNVPQGYIFVLKENPRVKNEKIANINALEESQNEFIDSVRQLSESGVISLSQDIDELVMGTTRNTLNTVALNITENQSNEIILRYGDLIEKVVPNFEVFVDLNVSVPKIGASSVWNSVDSQQRTVTGKGVKVAVLDTGIDYTHPDFGCYSPTQSGTTSVSTESNEITFVGEKNIENGFAFDEIDENQTAGYIVIFSEPSILEAEKKKSSEIKQAELNRGASVEAAGIAVAESIEVERAGETQKEKVKRQQNEVLGNIKNKVKQKRTQKAATPAGSVSIRGAGAAGIESVADAAIVTDIQVEEEGIEADKIVLQRYENILNGVALAITKEEAKEIKNIPGVKEVHPSRIFTPQLTESIDELRVDEIWKKDAENRECVSSGGECITGKGVSIAIIDTGVDYNHPDIDNVNCKPNQAIVSGTPQTFTLDERSPSSSYKYSDDSGRWANYWEISEPTFGKLALNIDVSAYDPTKGVFYFYRAPLSTGESTLNYLFGFAAHGYKGWTNELDTAPNREWRLIYYHYDDESSRPADLKFSVTQKLNGVTREEWQNCDKIKGGYSFVPPLGNDPKDDHRHGTHVASTAAGNGVLKGIALDAELYAYKVCTFAGSCPESSILAGIERALDPNQDGDTADHVDIISMSLGGSGYADDLLSRAVDNAVDSGITAVISAGNSGPFEATIGSPGTSEKAITVGATCKPYMLNNNWTWYCGRAPYYNALIWDDLPEAPVALFSSRGPATTHSPEGYTAIAPFDKPDIVAPGVDICAAKTSNDPWGVWKYYDPFSAKCLDDNHFAISGTSMAAPHVSGVVALIKQKHPDWTPEQIKMQIKNTAKDLGIPPFGNEFIGEHNYTQGAGMIDPYRAIIGEVEYPIAEIDSVYVEGDELVIIGSAYGNNFINYVLEYRNRNIGNYKNVKTGTSQIVDGEIGRIPFEEDSPFAVERVVIKLKVLNNDGIESSDSSSYERIAPKTGCRIIGGYKYNWPYTNEDFSDGHGHGTHVAGIVAGKGEDKDGDGRFCEIASGELCGVAPDAELYIYKVLGDSGSGSFYDVFRGMDRAVDPNQDGDFSDKVDVISMSLGAGPYHTSPYLNTEDFVDSIVKRGVSVVASAGNSGPGKKTLSYPSIAPRAISVGASCDSESGFYGCQTGGKIVSFSSRGFISYGSIYGDIKPNVVAPGVQICSAQAKNTPFSFYFGKGRGIEQCNDDKHLTLSGTSMAGPHVSGVVALIKQKHPEWDTEQIMSVLQNTANLFEGVEVEAQGFGEIDALSAVNLDNALAVRIYSVSKKTETVYEVNGSVYGGNIRNVKISYKPLGAVNDNTVAFIDVGVSVKNYGASGFREEVIGELDVEQMGFGTYLLKLEASNEDNTFIDYASVSLNPKELEGFPYSPASVSKNGDFDNDGDMEFIMIGNAIVDSKGEEFNWPNRYHDYSVYSDTYDDEYYFPITLGSFYYSGLTYANPVGKIVGGRLDDVAGAYSFYSGLGPAGKTIENMYGTRVSWGGLPFTNGRWNIITLNDSLGRDSYTRSESNICHKNIAISAFDFDKNREGKELLEIRATEPVRGLADCLNNQNWVDMYLTYPDGIIKKGPVKLPGALYLAGWSLYSGIVQSAFPADIDNDGDEEIIIFYKPFDNGATDEMQLSVFDSELNLLWSKRLKGIGHPAIYKGCYLPNIGDADGDYDSEIFVSCMGKVFAFDHLGNALPGWPIQKQAAYNPSAFCTAQPRGIVWNYFALADVDNNGVSEIILVSDDYSPFEGCGEGADKLWIYNLDGTLRQETAFGDMGESATPLFAGDIDGDYDKEIVYMDREYKLAARNLDATLSKTAGFPITVGEGIGYYQRSVVFPFNDVDGDGKIDVVYTGYNSIASGDPYSLNVLPLGTKYRQGYLDWPLLRSAVSDSSTELDWQKQKIKVFVNLHEPSPDDSFVENGVQEIKFRCSTNSPYGIVKTELYHNLGGAWQKVLENNGEEVSIMENIEGIADGNYRYNCKGIDNRGSENWGAERIIRIGSAGPEIIIESPGAITEEHKSILKVRTDEETKYINYKIDSGLFGAAEEGTLCVHDLFDNCTEAEKEIHLSEGEHELIINSEDLSGNKAEKRYSFAVNLNKVIFESFDSGKYLENMSRAYLDDGCSVGGAGGGSGSGGAGTSSLGISGNVLAQPEIVDIDYDSGNIVVGSDSGFVNLNVNDSADTDVKNFGITGNTIQSSDIIAHYKFEDNLNNENGGAGTPNGNPTYTAGRDGRAINLDGSGDYVKLGTFNNLNGANKFSVAFWINKKDTGNFPSHRGIFALGSSAQRMPWIWGTKDRQTLTAKFETVSGGPADCNINTGAISANTWTHIVLKWNGTRCQFYVNGGAGSIDSTTGNTLVNSDGSNRIGSISGYAEWYGGIDDVKVFNRDLTSQEIINLYNSYSGISTQTTQTCNNGVVEGTEVCDSNSQACSVSGSAGTQTCKSDCTGWNTCVANPTQIGLISHFKFEGNTNNENGGSGTAVGNPTYATGKSGQAIELNGNGQYVDLGTFTGLDGARELTISVWVNKKDAGNFPIIRGIFTRGTATNKRAPWLYGYSGTQGLIAGFGTTTNDPLAQDCLVGTGNINANEWTHVVLTWEGGKCSTYVNGVLRFFDSTTGTTLINTDGNNRIGSLTGFTGAGDWYGGIDDVRIYNKGMTASEVSALYNSYGGTQTCGNGIIEGTEICDGNSQACTVNGQAGTQSCNAQCTGFNTCVANAGQVCGNGIKEGTEQCDDGNLVAGDGCSSCIKEIEAVMAHYKFEDNLVDQNGGLGAPQGNPSYVTGKDGKAISLDGVDDYADMSYWNFLENTDKFTIAFWMLKKDSGNFPSHRGIVSRGAGNRVPWLWGVSGAQTVRGQFATASPQAEVGGPADCTVDTGTINANTWTHVIFWWNGTVCQFYVNGVASNSDTTTGEVLASSDGIGRIGFIEGFGKWNGGIDDLKIFRRDLTVQEIADLYGSYSIPGQICGNAIREGSEVCDGNLEQCTTINGEAGTKMCNAQCTGFSTCISGTQTCGNGQIEGTEVCDSNTQACTIGGQSGTQQCNAQCTGFNSCNACASGVVKPMSYYWKEDFSNSLGSRHSGGLDKYHLPAGAPEDFPVPGPPEPADFGYTMPFSLVYNEATRKVSRVYDIVYHDEQNKVMHISGRVIFPLDVENWEYPGAYGQDAFDQRVFVTQGYDNRRKLNLDSKFILSFDMRVIGYDDERYLRGFGGCNRPFGSYEGEGMLCLGLTRYKYQSFWEWFDNSVRFSYELGNELKPVVVGEGTGWTNVKLVYSGNNNYKVYMDDVLVYEKAAEPSPDMSRLDADAFTLNFLRAIGEVDNIMFTTDAYENVNLTDKNVSIYSEPIELSERIENIKADWSGSGDTKIFVSNDGGQQWCEMENGILKTGNECGFSLDKKLVYRADLRGNTASLDSLRLTWNGGPIGEQCVDSDLDGYGNPASIACEDTREDCNDNNPQVNPGAQEVCDGIDNNCVGGIDEGNVCVVPECTTNADCSDGLFCNGAETCDVVSGTCVAGTAVICNDGIACTTDSCNEETNSCEFDTSQCTCTTANQAVTCNDGNSCTDDVCLAGVCVNNNDNNNICDDAQFCTINDRCSAGSCIGDAKNAADTVSCTIDSCDEVNDVILHTPNNNACSNGLYCDGTETCNALTGCVAGTPPNVDDNIQCTIDSCNEASDTISHTASNARCDDGLYCDGNEICNAVSGCIQGTSPICEDDLACSVDYCDENINACVFDISRCGDCTTNAECDDSNSCTDDICNANLECVHINNNNACNDGNYCVINDRCSAGICTGDARGVSDGLTCTTDSCDEDNNVIKHIEDNSVCNNNLFCDGTETCSPSSANKNPTTGCAAGTAVTCNDDGIACTTNICDEESDSCKFSTSGCTCTTDAGCNDGNSCTDDRCVNFVCVRTNNNNVCDDNKFCTIADRCLAGSCIGDAINANDNIACTTDSCNEATDTIMHTPDNLICNNGLFCDGIETCNVNIGCVAGTQPEVDDGIYCTVDSCSAEINGPLHVPNNLLCAEGVCDPSNANANAQGCYVAPCVLTTARWGNLHAVEGEEVELIVTGENCDGKDIRFEVFEDDLQNDDHASQNPGNAVFVNGEAKTTWIAEYNEDEDEEAGIIGLTLGHPDPEPEYYFVSSLVADSNNKVESEKGNDLLSVVRLESVLPEIKVDYPENRTYTNMPVSLSFRTIGADRCWVEFLGQEIETECVYIGFFTRDGITSDLTSIRNLDLPESGNYLVNISASNGYGRAKESRNFTIVYSRTFLIYYEEFRNKGRTTSLDEFDDDSLKSVALTLDDAEHGRIEYTTALDITRNANSENKIIDLDSNINIEQGRIEMNSTALIEFNRNARIAFYNITFTNPRILKDGFVCDACTRVSYEGGVLTYNVPGFSTYTIEETPIVPTSGTPPADGGSSGGGGGGGGSYTPRTQSPVIPAGNASEIPEQKEIEEEEPEIADEEEEEIKEKSGFYIIVFIVLLGTLIFVVSVIVYLIRKHRIEVERRALFGLQSGRY